MHIHRLCVCVYNICICLTVKFYHIEDEQTFSAVGTGRFIEAQEASECSHTRQIEASFLCAFSRLLGLLLLSLSWDLLATAQERSLWGVAFPLCSGSKGTSPLIAYHTPSQFPLLELFRYSQGSLFYDVTLGLTFRFLAHWLLFCLLHLLTVFSFSLSCTLFALPTPSSAK